MLPQAGLRQCVQSNNLFFIRYNPFYTVASLSKAIESPFSPIPGIIWGQKQPQIAKL